MPLRLLAFQKLKDFCADESGSVAVLAALGIVVFLGFAALVLDLGHMYSVRNELQKAADAGALAGARAINMPPPYPDFANGQTVATGTVQQNKADQTLLTNCQVQVGYWDMAWRPETAPATLLPTGTSPTASQVPACRVTVSRSGGNNGGPLTMWFANLLGFDTRSLSAGAVGVVLPGAPVDAIPPGDAFPLATPIHWVNLMWRNDRDSDSFRVGSTYHYEEGGEWTSFLIDANDVPTIRDLIDNGNPGPLKVGDQIWIEPGTKTTLYADAESRIGDTVLLPIVPDDFATHDHTTLLAFVPFKIEDAKGGSGKYIQGHFVPHYAAPGSTGASSASNFGAIGYNIKLVK